ncbi:MAG: glycosyltransferase [Thermodesulfobacteriota bacterium]
MEELRRYKVVPLDEYNPADPTHVSITFDGVYENVFTYAFPILKKFGYPFELFIVGQHIGQDNKFDQGVEPPAKFADINQLKKMVNFGGRLQWHSWSHKLLKNLNDQQEIRKEIMVPDFLRKIDPRGFKWFAYPHGEFDNDFLECLKVNFKGALACHQGDNNNIFHLNRFTVTDNTRFHKSSVSLIIANYNYGRFLAEAIESAIHQTIIPEEILFIDDCSEDNSLEVANRYKGKIRLIKNEKNLGIVDNFNKAVALTSGDYICILGADNRLRSDFVEKCKFALDSHPDAAIAYTNVVIFGPRAEVLAHKVRATAVEEKNDIFLWRFPEFNEESKKSLERQNFIHGSSMYRRLAFNEVGGYKKTGGPEDHNLFFRIIKQGWKAVLCPDFLLEYRQHSNSQANTHLNLGHELAFVKRQLKLREAQIIDYDHKLRYLLQEKKITSEALEKVSFLAKENKIEEAIKVLENTFRKFPEQAKLLLQYLLLIQIKGEDNRGKDILEIASLYDPFYTKEIKKRIFSDGKEIKSEPNNYQAAKQRAKRDDEYKETQKIIEYETEEKAISYLEDFITHNPQHALAHNDLGILYFKKNEKEKALEFLKKAEKLDPENIDILKNLSDFYLEAGNPEESLIYLKKILEMDFKDNDALAKAGYCLFQMGNLKDASYVFEKVLEIEPKNRLAREYLDKIQNNRNIKGEISNLKSDKDLVEHSSPMVSIIVPVWNNLELSHKCLKSILLNTKDGDYEIIFVDNGSTDGTRDYLENLNYKNIKKIFLDQNIGFVGACNSGARLASGKYLLFLNNDTEVQKDWLKALVDLAESTPDCGAVGSKLIYPNERLQEAGGIIFSDGNGWNYGRGMDPNEPKFNYVREVDYCSGAALMVRKDLWDKIGGFDERYAPAYYEDTDICFEIRKNGYKVYYQPKSIVIHHEGKTAGIDLQSGYKKFQTINREKFISKWSYELMEQLPNDPKNIFKAANRGIRRNILVIDTFLPFFDRASGSLRLFQIMKMLKEMKFHITFIARYGSMEEYYRPILESMGIEVYAWDPLAMKAAGYIIDSKKYVPYETLLKERKYEFALIEFWDVAGYYLPIIRKHSPETKIIIDTVDIHFVRNLREAEVKKNDALKKEALLKKEKEIAIYRKADRLWVVTEEDKKAIKDYVTQIPIDIIPNIHSLSREEKNYEDSSDLLFVGNFNHPPNHDGIQYFCKEIHPLILNKLPDVKLYIVGNNPPSDIRSLSSEKIIVTGYVKDLSSYLRKARVSVNPLRYGAGMKGKIGEALSWGLPVVTTSIGAEGMGLADGVDALIGDSAEDFAHKVIRLYEDKELWAKLSINGKKRVENEWSPQSVKSRLERIFFANEGQNKEKVVSIIILAHNQLSYTRMCIESIWRYTNVPYELIIIDNGSTDKTPEFLEKLSKGEEVIADWRIWTDSEGRIIEKKRVNIHKKKKNKGGNKIFCERFKFIRCDRNLGFAAGNNLGISEAKGDYLLLMNNDIVVTPHWLNRLLRVAEIKPEIGIVGPVSNYVSGPQQVKEIAYDIKSLNNLNQFAESWARKKEHQTKPFWRVVGFCMLIKREVISKIGGLDERFGLGNFEDDDFCLRAKLAGFESRIAEDCFIHHFGSKTFREVVLDYPQTLKTNWEIFKEKWGIPRDLAYGTAYNLENILKGGFSFKKHYCPVIAEEPSLFEGEELFKSGNLLQAKEIFEKILGKDPQNKEALNNLGVIAYQEGKSEEAISYFTKVLESDPNFLAALENIGQCLMEKNSFAEAIHYFQKFLKIEAHETQVLNKLGACFLRIGDFDRAQEIYKQSLFLDSTQGLVKEILDNLERLKNRSQERSACL